MMPAIPTMTIKNIEKTFNSVMNVFIFAISFTLLHTMNDCNTAHVDQNITLDKL